MIILVVEPNVHFLNQYKSSLEGDGYHHTVIGASDGIIALNVINDRSINIDAVITSYEVDATNGLELLAAIAASGRNTPTLLQHTSWQITIEPGAKKLQRFLTIEAAPYSFACVYLKILKSTHIDKFLASIDYPAQSYP